MAEAKKMSQLISKSLRHELGKDETREVANHLQADEQSRHFTDLSRAIQSSVVHGADIEETENGTPGLPSEIKHRMKESIAAASTEKLRLSKTGLLRSGTADDSIKIERKQDQLDAVRQVTSRFRLIRRLGEGGLGNVWLARDEKLNRNVAVKELNAHSLQSPMAWQRFQREAEITGQLEHPNIVPIYHFGDDRKTGEPFYTMRFVGKRTLADAIEEHHDRVEAGEDMPIGLHRLLSVFLDVCQAIAYAHSRGVVHRDLKPENVALDSFGQVIVLDWGLAKVTDDGELAHQLTSEADLSDSSLAHTMQGDIVGTPLYMAPEQASGDLNRVDEQTDVYGLGAILFAILTGKAPHEQSAAESPNPLPTILRKIADGEAPRPREYVRSVPSDLEDICMKAMAKKQHLRFGGVQPLADAVERWMAGQSQKQTRYETLRMEGRELRADLQSTVSDLERNARFMSRLPPIQQLMTAQEEQDVADWRQRLATIFRGLLEANPDYKSVLYSRVGDDTFKELVRVERHSKDSTRIRVVPRSRLRETAVSDCIRSIVEQKPEEVVTGLVCDPLSEAADDCSEQSFGLVAGVPVYDETTEESFGIVMIDCDINEVLRKQLGRRLSCGEVIVACDVFHIMMHYHEGQIEERTIGKPVTETADYFGPAMQSLQTELEYIDEANADVYGARLWFIPNKHGLMYLLKQKND